MPAPNVIHIQLSSDLTGYTPVSGPVVFVAGATHVVRATLPPGVPVTSLTSPVVRLSNTTGGYCSAAMAADADDPNGTVSASLTVPSNLFTVSGPGQAARAFFHIFDNGVALLSSTASIVTTSVTPVSGSGGSGGSGSGSGGSSDLAALTARVAALEARPVYTAGAGVDITSGVISIVDLASVLASQNPLSPTSQVADVVAVINALIAASVPPSEEEETEEALQ